MDTEDERKFKYLVRMRALIGPSRATQVAHHKLLTKTDDIIIETVTIKTFDFPYSYTFDLEQTWTFKKIDEKTRSQSAPKLFLYFYDYLTQSQTIFCILRVFNSKRTNIIFLRQIFYFYG